MSLFALGECAASAHLGGKADAWLRLFEAGIPVPDGFCIPADVAIDESEIATALAALRHRTGSDLVAVRSSGIGEDGHETALAGLFESYLDVEPTPSSVAAKCVQCRANGRSNRTLAALGKVVEIAIIVQEMLRPTRSGVLFTRNPLSGDADEVVEVVQGHLSILVESGSAAVRLSLSDETATALLPEERRELRRIANLVESTLGTPADLEWASLNGKIIVLQARPITTLRTSHPRGLTLVPTSTSAASTLPHAVRRHDKVALRLVAAEHGISISAGFIVLANSPAGTDFESAAATLEGWGEFIAVLLDPFHLDGKIHRTIGHGRSARDDLSKFCRLAARLESYTFLLKELQETASTGVAVRLPNGGVRIEVIHGHFITKGHESPRSYILSVDGAVVEKSTGSQSTAVMIVGGKPVEMRVTVPVMLSDAQIAEIRRAVMTLHSHYPEAGIEFGFTPVGDFFLVDLYRGKSVVPPSRDGVISEGRVTGIVRRIETPENAIQESIERHVNSRRGPSGRRNDAPTIIVVSRPFHLLDTMIFDAAPDTLGFIFDGGALLCHLAVVMRERGVPGLIREGATREFSDGDRVVLDTRPGSTEFLRRI